jgi:hypothetical protein
LEAEGTTPTIKPDDRMTNMVPDPQIRDAARQILELLVAKRYQAPLSEMTEPDWKPPADGIQREAEGYPATFRIPAIERN